MHYALQYVKDLFIGLFTFFDRIFIDTGYIVWVGSAFLMVITYRFLIRPVFGSFSIASFGSDDNKTFRHQQKVVRVQHEKKQNHIASARYNMQNRD